MVALIHSILIQKYKNVPIRIRLSFISGSRAEKYDSGIFRNNGGYRLFNGANHSIVRMFQWEFIHNFVFISIGKYRINNREIKIKRIDIFKFGVKSLKHS